MAKGIYERKGRNGDVTYYIRYQFKTVDGDGNETIKDLKEKVGRKSRGFTRELAREALKAREGEVAQGRFNLEKVRKPPSDHRAFGALSQACGELQSVV